MIPVSPERLEAAYQRALAALLAERTPEGHWVGELSTSALSTATAVMALALVQKHVPTAGPFDALIGGGLDWLAAHQNADGGWGDTDKSVSNISTTMLCRAAFYIAAPAACGLAFAECGTTFRKLPANAKPQAAVRRAEAWLAERYGDTPAQLAEAVRARYGKDRTFAVPILTTCALAGLIDWREVPPLPFELARFPQAWFRLLRLHVVSYALPALIAIGQCIHFYAPRWNPFTRFIRWLAKKRSLQVLERIQPPNGGFLEATPLTSFVTLSLAAIGRGDHPVARKGIAFIKQSVRPDGGWPIDTNLSTWVTTLSINALAAAGNVAMLGNVPKGEVKKLRHWVIKQQARVQHPYTGAAPGGWAWTPLPGGVPDADDTPGALLALPHLDIRNVYPFRAILAVRWLLGLQNSDGGWPTFCRGWGHLPFDRSGADLTAHALRAFSNWRPRFVRHWEEFEDSVSRTPLFDRILMPGLRNRYRVPLAQMDKSVRRGLDYLFRNQRPDGSWLPLWFGNQHAPDDANPTYGTARVLAAYRDLNMMDSEPARRGVAWLLANQNADGGWGGCLGTPSSMEETALAVEILVDVDGRAGSVSDRSAPVADAPGSPLVTAVNNGLRWLVQQVESGGLQNPSPIGFYFAKLWYYEKLYPIIFTVAALGRARKHADWT